MYLYLQVRLYDGNGNYFLSQSYREKYMETKRGTRKRHALRWPYIVNLILLKRHTTINTRNILL